MKTFLKSMGWTFLVLGAVIMTAFRFIYPQWTETQLFIRLWPLVAVTLIGGAIALIAADYPERDE